MIFKKLSNELLEYETPLITVVEIEGDVFLGASSDVGVDFEDQGW